MCPIFVPNCTLLLWFGSISRLVELWFIFWKNVVEPKCLWWGHTSLICRHFQVYQKKLWLRTQIWLSNLTSQDITRVDRTSDWVILLWIWICQNYVQCQLNKRLTMLSQCIHILFFSLTKQRLSSYKAC